jgi:hypothetical protein
MSGNSKAASLAARLVEPNTSAYSKRNDESDDNDDAIFAELEEEIANDDSLTVREQGLQLLKAEMERTKKMQQDNHGKYTEITDEKEVIRVNESHDV